MLQLEYLKMLWKREDTGNHSFLWSIILTQETRPPGNLIEHVSYKRLKLPLTACVAQKEQRCILQRSLNGASHNE